MPETKEREEDFAKDLEAQYVVEEDGRIEIRDDVIARIAGIATTEIDGVQLESKFGLSDLIGRKDKEPVKGIAVERNPEENSVAIVCSVRMAYGKDMYDLALALRKHVRETVEKMTRARVSRVDVRIVGIILGDKEKEKEHGELLEDEAE